MFSKDLGFLGYGTCFQKAKGSGSWLMFSENERFWILAHVFRGPRILGSWLMFFRGPRFLGFGSSFQRTKGSGSWLIILEDLEFFDPSSCYQRT